MSSFKSILIKVLIIVALAILFPFSYTLSSSYFTDVPADPLYSPHINELLENNLITGYADLNGASTGIYGPNDTIKRSEFAKISAIVRLAEIYGDEDGGWNNMDKDTLTLTLENKLKYYHRCINNMPNCSTIYGADMIDVCNVCTGIGGIAFQDVQEDEEDCQSKGMCSWYAKYVYYSARKGTVKGYTEYTPPKYKPGNDILRIHALKMIIVDNGNISPESDTRYARLNSLANSNNSYTPKCLKGVENYIRDNNGGDAEDTEKLLKYAILADRLDLFGNNCQVFTDEGVNMDNPEEVAYFLQQPVLRKEIPRYLSITTTYSPIEPDPKTDTTINTSEENKQTEASEVYVIPEFIDPTPNDDDKDTYNRFEEESNTETIIEGNTRIIYNTETGEYTVQDIATGIVLEEGIVEEGTTIEELIQKPSVTENSNLNEEDREKKYGEVTDVSETMEGEDKTIEQQMQEEDNEDYTDPYEFSESDYIISVNTNLECNAITIPKGTQVQTYAVNKQGGNFVQGVSYGDYYCQISCDILNTLECRETIAQEERELENRIETNMDFYYNNDTRSALDTCVWAYKDDKGNIKPQSTRRYVLSWCNEHGITRDEIRVELIHDQLDEYMANGHTSKETCDVGLKASMGNEFFISAVQGWCDENVVEKEGRAFKTSIPSVNIRMEAKVESNLLKTISATKSNITVLGKAVTGEYVDVYKTNQWYPVKCENCKDKRENNVEIGYILTSLLHAEKLGNEKTGYFEIDDNFSHTGFSRGNSKITGIVLHATLGNGSATGDRDAIPTSGKLNGVGAHYYVDQNGVIAQALQDYKKIHHAGYSGGWENVERDGSNFTIGIEIANYGPIKTELKDDKIIKKNVYNNIVNVNITNIKNTYNKAWKIWNYFHVGNYNSSEDDSKVDQGNVAWSAFGEEVNEKIENWQTYNEKQLKSVVLLIEYLEERYGLPENNYFQYNNPNNYEGLTNSEVKKYSYYYYPKNADERIEYNNAVRSWRGIFQHHNMTGKFDNGVGLNIDELIRIRNEF